MPDLVKIGYSTKDPQLNSVSRTVMVSPSATPTTRPYRTSANEGAMHRQASARTSALSGVLNEDFVAFPSRSPSDVN